MAELSGAPIGAAVAESGAAGVALSGLSALAAPLAALAGAAVIGTSIFNEFTDESSSDVRSRLTGQVLQFFAANPWIRPTLDADAYNDAAWQAIARGGMDNPYRGIANVMSDDASFMGQIGAGGGMNESQIEAMLVANAPASSWFRAQNPYSQTGDLYPSSGGDYGHAEGALFRTSGRTRMEVGEAGTETVAILRNPRSVDLPAGGGGETGLSADVLAELRGMSNRLEQMVRSLSRIERSKTTWN
jgi:hypothetical protein